MTYAIQNPRGEYLVSFISDGMFTTNLDQISTYNKKETAEFIIKRHKVLKDCIAVEINIPNKQDSTNE
jgi:hypothetical protein